MNKNDIPKVMAAGFRVLRLSTYKVPCYIHEASGRGGWKIIGKYETKTEAEKVFADLMKDPKNLEG